MIFQNDDGYSIGDISPDGNTIALNKITTRDDSNIYLYDCASKKVTHATPHEGEINFNAVTFSPDGKELYIVSDADSEFSYLLKHNMESGERTVVAKPEWDVAFATFSKKGKYFAYGVNQDARMALKVFQNRWDGRS